MTLWQIRMFGGFGALAMVVLMVDIVERFAAEGILWVAIYCFAAPVWAVYGKRLLCLRYIELRNGIKVEG